MRKLPLGFAALAAVLSLSSVQAADLAALRAYAAKSLPRCPNGSVAMEQILQSGPAGFETYKITQTSSDERCGSQQLLLYSPTSGQTMLGKVMTLPVDSTPVEKRVADYASKSMKVPVTVQFAPLTLPDGVRQILMTRNTDYGPFSYRAYLDKSNRFLMLTRRGSLSQDPSLTLKSLLGLEAAARRGNSVAKNEIIEISDFQCPSCAHAHETLEPYLSKNLGKVRYARLDLPLFEHHEWAISASMAARAIQKVAPKKYWQFVDTVFKNQESIGKRPFDTFLKEFLEDNDISWAKIEPAYRSKSDRAALLEQVSRFYAAGVASTPTFILNGQILGYGEYAVETIKKTLEGK